MPTKHKRKRGDDESQFNLPPTVKARSLPIIEPTKDFLTPRNTKKQKLDKDSHKDKKPKNNVDDTPKAFARLMAWHQGGKKIGGGLDNGGTQSTSKKNKAKSQSKPKQATTAATQTVPEPSTTITATNTPPAPPEPEPKTLKILPGESLRDFSLRVDQSLPLSSLPKHNPNPNTLPSDLQAALTKQKAASLTKHNKRLARMQADWRKTEAKLKAREEDEIEENIEKIEEERILWEGVKVVGKKGKKKQVVDDDPWKELERKRRAEEGRNRVKGLTARDQAQAPPSLGVLKNIFKERPLGKQRQAV